MKPAEHKSVKEKELTRFEIQTIYKNGRITYEYVIAEDITEAKAKYVKHHRMDKIEEYSVIGHKYNVKETDVFYDKKTIY